MSRNERFPNVFSEVELGGLLIPNRIVFPAMEMELWTSDEHVTPQLLHVYRSIASGGAGLVFIGPAYPALSGKPGPRTPGLDSDGKIGEISKLVRVVLENNAVPAVQLLHAGRYAGSVVTGGLGPVAPSPVPSPILFRETPRELSEEEIWGIIDSYVMAAVRAEKAGCRVVEIHAGMGYLPAQFLSPRTNKRRDSWGGTLENRARFILEVLGRVKESVSIPVTVRYSLLDFLDDGVSLEESLTVIRWIVDQGVDAVSLVFGWHESPVPLISREVPPGGFAKYCRKVKDLVEIPVIYGTRVTDLSVAEEIIGGGLADMVAMGRALIADPSLPRKQRAGLPHRPCIACSHCLSSVFLGRHVTCTVNPGFLRPDVPRVEGGGKAAVVGGGPAGMEAALTLAERGFEVTLYEREDSLGGMLRYAAMEPYGGEFRALIRYYESELSRLGVEVVLGKAVKPHELGGFDLIVLATGPVLDLAWAPKGSRVVPWWEGFEKPPRESALIVGSNVVGVGLADFLADRGVRTYVIDWARRPGRGLEKVTRWIVLGRLKRHGVKFLMRTSLASYRDGNATLRLPDGSSMEVEVEVVYGAARFRPAKPGEEWLKLGKRLVVVGNALHPSLDAMLMQAIHSARHAVLRV